MYQIAHNKCQLIVLNCARLIENVMALASDT